MNALSSLEPDVSGNRQNTSAAPISAAAAASDSKLAPANPRRRAILISSSSLVLIALFVAAWIYWVAPGHESTDSAFIDGHRIPLAAQASGRVSEVLVDDNESVAAGQVVLRIDPADYRVKLEQAEAAQAQAESALAHAQAQLPVTEATARQAGAQVKIAEANARKTSDDLRRYRQLSENAVSHLVLDAASTQESVGTAQVEAAHQAAIGAEAQIALAQTAVNTAKANLRAAAAQVALAQLALSYCEVKAPVAGTVTRKNVEPGNYIQLGQPLLNLVTEDLYVTANFKETQLTHLNPGQSVAITVDTFPGITFSGHVDSRMAGTGSAFALLPPENATGNFVKVVQRVPVKIVFDRDETSPRPPLALGLSVIATVNVGEKSAANSQTASRR